MLFQKLSYLLLSRSRGLQSYHPPVNQKDDKEWLFIHSLKDGIASCLLWSLRGTHDSSHRKSKPPRASFSWAQATSGERWCLWQQADDFYVNVWFGEWETWEVFCSHPGFVLLSCSGLVSGKPRVYTREAAPGGGCDHVGRWESRGTQASQGTQSSRFSCCLQNVETKAEVLQAPKDRAHPVGMHRWLWNKCKEEVISTERWDLSVLGRKRHRRCVWNENWMKGCEASQGQQGKQDSGFVHTQTWRRHAYCQDLSLGQEYPENWLSWPFSILPQAGFLWSVSLATGNLL